MSIPEMKDELKSLDTPFADCFDKESLIQRLKEARGKSQPTSSHDKPAKGNEKTMMKSDGGGNSTINRTDSTLPTGETTKDEATVLGEIRSLRVKELREELAKKNIRWADLLEKEDLVRAVYRARREAAHFSVTGMLSPGEVGELTAEQLEQELGEMPNVPLLLDAYAVWCGPCQMMAPQLREASRVFGNRVRVAKIDTDQHPTQASKLGIQGLPTLLLFQNGKEVARVEGALMKDQVVQWVESKL